MSTIRKVLTALLCCLLAVPVSAQRVGLVLSGGGAKGLTHVGIIHALEDYGVPIDYITGSSIGAIIGSLYAMGYTPEEMMAFIASPAFRKCYANSVDEKDVYFVRKNEPTPELFYVRSSVGDSLNFSSPLPTSLIDPTYINMMVLQVFSQATAACEGNFDNLFVPFRCLASDVYHKESILFDHGDLGKAVRASMTFPFVFRPIEVDGRLAYDGGIFNNFPADIMKEQFHPDFIIGSTTSHNTASPTSEDLLDQIETMITARSNYQLPDSAGILFDFDFKGEVGLLDFDKAQQLHDVGYKATVEWIDSIRSRVPRIVPSDSLAMQRRFYRATLPELEFHDIIINGATEKQRIRLEHELRRGADGALSLEEFREAYFRLLSDDAVTELRPTAVWNADKQQFDLVLDVVLEDNVSLALGGAFSTGNINQIYFGINYNRLSRQSTELTLNGQIGRTYNNVQLSGRLDIPSDIPVSLRLTTAYSTIDYYRQDYLFSGSSEPSLNKEHEAFVKAKMALPFLWRQKLELGFGGGIITDICVPSPTVDFSHLVYDTNVLRLLGGSVFFGGSTLDSPQYATSGSSQYFLAQVFGGTDSYNPGVRSHLAEVEDEVSPISWMQVKVRDERYFPLSQKFHLGVLGEAFYSTHPFMQTFASTMMQMGAFTPTASSTFTYNSFFRSDCYAAAGIIPVVSFSDIFSLRLEAYGFLPIRPILQADDLTAVYGKPLSRFGHIEECSFVGRFSTIVASAWLSHNNSPQNPWTIGLTIGWQLWNNRFVEQ